MKLKSLLVMMFTIGAVECIAHSNIGYVNNYVNYEDQFQ